jgi:phage tail-like protein
VVGEVNGGPGADGAPQVGTSGGTVAGGGAAPGAVGDGAITVASTSTGGGGSVSTATGGGDPSMKELEAGPAAPAELPPGDDGGDGSPPATRGPRSMAPMPMGFPQGRRRSDWLVGQLPVGMLDSDFFLRFASIFQEQSGTYLDAIDSLPNIIDPAVAPPSMVRFLAGWLALPPLRPSMDELDQRRTVMEMAEIRRWRGTKRGLTDLLALLTGGEVDISDRSGVFRAGTGGEHLPLVTIRVNSTGWLSEHDLIEVVLDEVPAHASMELFVGERKIWPMASAEDR